MLVETLHGQELVDVKDRLFSYASGWPLRSYGEGLLLFPPLADNRLVVTREGAFSIATRP